MNLPGEEYQYPPEIIALFAPRPPLEFKPPIIKKKLPSYSCISDILKINLEKAKENEKLPKDAEWKKPERYYLRKNRIRKENEEKLKLNLQIKTDEWMKERNLIPGEPENTLFIGRLAYTTTEDSLREKFEKYGKIVKITIAKDKETGKSRGYGFIEYERKRDMVYAYEYNETIEIDGRKAIVDQERGRIKPNFKPRRLGGGKGPGRVKKLKKGAKPPYVPQTRSRYRDRPSNYRDSYNSRSRYEGSRYNRRRPRSPSDRYYGHDGRHKRSKY